MCKKCNDIISTPRSTNTIVITVDNDKNKDTSSPMTTILAARTSHNLVWLLFALILVAFNNIVDSFNTLDFILSSIVDLDGTELLHSNLNASSPPPPSSLINLRGGKSKDEEMAIKSDKKRATESKNKKKKKLVIAGVVRNGEKDLPHIKRTILRVLDELRPYGIELHRLVFYENDSHDKTVQLIKEDWNLNSRAIELYGKSEVISEDNIEQKYERMIAMPGRTNRLAHGRNQLLKRIQEIDMGIPDRESKVELNLKNSLSNKYNHDDINAAAAAIHSNIDGEKDIVDYVLFLDTDDTNFDLQNTHLCFDPVEGEMPTNKEWGACSANQYDIYYDLWALRTYDSWSPCDVHYRGKDHPDSCSQWDYKKFRHVSALEKPMKVRSAFGGASFYNYNLIRDAIHNHGVKYYGERDHDKSEICEHVSFHNGLHDYVPGFTIYIQTKMMNNGKYEDGAFKVHREKIKASETNTVVSKYYQRPPKERIDNK